ncbi:MAG TPA: DUF4870 domain-containing protein [Terriglobia bacterium]|nr:DUF4870 domain-containing protein [Terriglobia bacterium]
MEPETVSIAPTPDERTLAMLAHILQVVSGFVGPLIIFLVKRESRFVAFHAAQALIWQVVYFAFAAVTMVVWFVVIFSTVFHQTNSTHPNIPPAALFVAFPLIWGVPMVCWIVSIILGIVYGIKANQGEWAGYPIIGRWARRLVRI